MSKTRKSLEFPQLQCGVASNSDEPALREFYSKFEVPGDIVLRFSRDPNFFQGPEQLGQFTLLQATDAQSRKVRGMLSRNVRSCYVEGAPAPVGFINHLRAERHSHSLKVLGALCEALREEEEQTPSLLTLASISEGNANAMGILVKTPLKRFPRLFPIEEFLTFSLPARTRLPRIAREATLEQMQCEAGQELLTQNDERNFRPFMPSDTYAQQVQLGLTRESFFQFTERGRTLVKAALWDQTAYKQVTISAFSPRFRMARPVVNLMQKTLGYRSLPQVGGRLRPFYLSFLSVAENCPASFARALPSLLARVQLLGGDQLVISLSKRDPLVAAVSRYGRLSYRSNLCIVSFKRQFPAFLSPERVCHIEPGFL